MPTIDDVLTALREVRERMTDDLGDRIDAVPTTAELVVALRDLLGGMTLQLDATAIEDLFHAALDDLPHVTAAATVPEKARDDDDMAPGVGGEMGDAAAEAPVPAAVSGRTPGTVGIKADVVADLVGSPGSQNDPAGHRGWVPAVVGPTRMIDTPAPDRPVDEAMNVVALLSRRH